METTNTTTPLQNGASSPKAARRMAIWLLFMCGLLAAMIIVGGATRLTDSGLSITEWKPVTGAIPPLSEEAWLVEFEKYKAIPEYEIVNFGMSLEHFKEIYWWEWGHRFLGRVIGIAFLIPFLFFVFAKYMDRRLAQKLGLLFVLGGIQGALGWWMVSSGLVNRIDVSQYRLAAHLALAILLFALMFWFVLDLWPVKRVKADAQKLYPFAIGLSAIVFCQIILGAFVSGLRAGRTFNTWPLMDGQFFPAGYFAGTPSLNDLFETIPAVQFNHRIGAYVVAISAIVFVIKTRGTSLAPRARMVLAFVGLQIALGIWTLLAATPISLGLMHQAGGLAVFAACVYAAHGAKQPA